MKATMEASRLDPHELFGRRVAQQLDGAATLLPRDVTERLRAARVQATALRKRPLTIEVPSLRRAGAVFGGTAGGAATGSAPSGSPRGAWWTRLASALPVALLAAGLVAIHVVENDRRARELAEVDAALLTDTLPPAAYADPGFVQFLHATP